MSGYSVLWRPGSKTNELSFIKTFILCRGNRDKISLGAATIIKVKKTEPEINSEA